MDLTKYLVHGDLDWTALPDGVRAENEKYAAEIVGNQPNYSKYSLYTIQLARLLKDSCKKTGLNANAKEPLDKAFKDFAEKYNKDMIASHTEEFKKIEDPVTAMRKNGYAARDLKVALDMAVKQAEYKSGKPVADKKDVVDRLFKSATEPGVVKEAMIMEFLKALPGIPTVYSGDELGMTGYEEKAKNVYLQNRNVLPWTEVDEDSIIGRYRRTIRDTINGTLKDRSNPELAPLNNGTPYPLEVATHSRTRSEIRLRLNEINGEYGQIDALKKEGKITEEAAQKQKADLAEEQRKLTKDLAKLAYLMQNANGDVTISVMNAGDVDFSNRCNYFDKIQKEYKISLDTDEKRKKFLKDNNIESINPDNPYVPILPKSELDMILLGAGIALPVGTVFMNANAKDKTEYVVKQVGDKKAIVRKDGGKIVMDGMTAKNGVMILKKIKNIIFKGHQNKYSQYNFVSNPYKHSEHVEEGQKLSIVAK